MLTRLRFRRNIKPMIRCLSDKPSDKDPKLPEDDQKSPKSQKQPTENYTEKIQELLKVMMNPPKAPESEFQFTTAPEKQKRVKASDEIEVKFEKIEESLTKAAGEVAQSLGGDVKQTEAELLSKVLGKIDQTSTTLSDLLVGMPVDRSRGKDNEGLQQETRGKHPRYIQRKGTEDRKPSDLLVGMQVDRSSKNDTKAPQEETRGQMVRRLMEKSRAERPRYIQRKGTEDRRPSQGQGIQPINVEVFSGEPLNIFKSKPSQHGPKLDVWESLKQREVMLATSQPPANYFEKMIQWTNQGKVWKFPIDNEQGMEEEQSVHFSEHIFLDQHLEDWCPKKGPIRHFMELVCVGLSKNAFYTVQEKKEHIMWYKEYFETKKDLLEEVGAWDNVPKPSNEAST